ncbi:MAG: penicillin-binding protein activator [Pseudomonadota bacterium]
MLNLSTTLAFKRFGALAAALTMAACATTTGPSDKPKDQTATDDPIGLEAPTTLPDLNEDNVVRVALLLPFSSTSQGIASLADGMLKAAQMVAFESGNESFLLIPGDTLGTPQGARAAAEEAIAEGADVILGPLLSNSVAAVSAVTRARDVPVIAFSTDRLVAGNGVYLLSFPPEPEIERVTSYALQKGYARFGLLAPITNYGDRVSQALGEEIFNGGGTLVHTERYIRNADDMREPAKRLAEYAAPGFVPQYVTPRYGQTMPQKPAPQTSVFDGAGDFQGIPTDGSGGLSTGGYGGGSDVPLEAYDPMSDGFQAVLLPESGRLLRALAPLLPYNDVDVREIKLLGVSAWNNPRLTGEPALQGGWFAAPDPELSRGFTNRYRAAYGESPPRLASLAYDATLITARLAEMNTEDKFADGLLTNPNGFLGADGLFRLTEEGLVERGLAILEINRSGIRVIDPAPLTFQTKTYRGSY